MISFIFGPKDKSTTCHCSVLMNFAAHTELKCIAHELENQNIREEYRVTLSTRELVCSEMQPSRKIKEITQRLIIKTLVAKWYLTG